MPIEIKRLSDLSESAAEDPDQQTRYGQIELEHAEAELNLKKADVAAARWIVWARKLFAPTIYGTSVVWLSAVLVVLILCGRKWLELSDAVLIALLTTTTINVLAWFVAVVAFLFDHNRNFAKRRKRRRHRPKSTAPPRDPE